jgi:hypothetical protein
MAKTTWEMDGFDWDVEGYEGRKIAGLDVLSLVPVVKEEDARRRNALTKRPALAVTGPAFDCKNGGRSPAAVADYSRLSVQ